ncbi:MAG: DUF4367 domain-containing protein [Clostridiales bacterium]|nr:DUF4367 domain-containing protein [Clostridiales bacterium]
MKQEMDDWLKQKIDEDLIAMTEEREQQLMELEAFQKSRTREQRLEELHRALKAEEARVFPKRVRARRWIAVAAVMVLCIGAGVVGSGHKLYVPEIFQRERGGEVTTKINNAEAVPREYDEESVCQEIEEKLGVVPIRFGYRPDGMKLIGYELNEESGEAIMKYEYEEAHIHVYVSKDYEDASIGHQVDGEELEQLILESYGMKIPIYQYEDPDGQTYFEASFEFLNTYYSISGMMKKGEFIKILENIAIKNA